MMRLLWLFLAVFVSPELLVALIIFGLYFFSPSLFGMLGQHLKNDKEVWKYLPILPVALVTYVFSMSSKVRVPSKEELNKVLYEWPLYKLLVDRTDVGIFYSVICVVFSLITWILGGGLEDSIIGLLFFEAIVVSAVSALAMYEAAQKIQEILIKNSSLK